ncbi:hypothetical protein EJ08DRAFT_695171 [Tothia fuscella]|uniref:Uncharacterized protein n=1 Tax=Tothia fuscella TaxID=1048955 RepID=A0A9P4U1B6_9PEZI|nr:hypothetical protein EJ08DRAFT_695171 [Tothia fuscella]
MDAYLVRYSKLEQAYVNGHYKECIRFAKLLIQDTEMPPIIIIKSLILISCASDDINESEEYRKAAETHWYKTTASMSEISEELLELRQDLDDLKPLTVYGELSQIKKPMRDEDEEIEGDSVWEAASKTLDEIEKAPNATIDDIKDLVDSLQI